VPLFKAGISLLNSSSANHYTETFIKILEIPRAANVKYGAYNEKLQIIGSIPNMESKRALCV